MAEKGGGVNNNMKSRAIANFKKLNWMPLFDEIKISKCVLIHKSLTGNSPSYINDLFVTNSMLHNSGPTVNGLICCGFQA